MSDLYYSVNIRRFLDEDDPAYIGEDGIKDLISDFSCPNPDVEYFLHHSAVEFTKKNQSVTYLVFDAAEGSVVGYYSLAIKPITVSSESVSKSVGRRLSRVSTINESDGSYTTAAYLIAQLGKNFSLPKEKRVSGSDLLNLALDSINKGVYSFGGIMRFLECDADVPFLMQFYQQNGFAFFDDRITQPAADGTQHHLNLLLKVK